MDVNSIFFGAQSFFSSFYNSTFFAVIKFFLAIYVIVLLVDIVLLLIHRGLGTDLSKTLYGAELPPAHKGQFMKKWKVIQERLKSGNEAQFKISILEADTIVNDVLDKAGLQGENMRERLDRAHEMQVENKDRLIWAHDVRNKIVQDESYSIDEKLTRDVIGVYEDFLRSWETL
jgi:hypothetical protein